MSLFEAIRANDAAALKRILQETPGALRERDERGNPPLVLATYLNHAAASKALVEAGADLDAQGMAGTALMGVSFRGYPELTTYLLEAGADPDVQHENGSTALIFAAMFNKEDIVDILLRHGARTTIKDNNGLTAADHARSKGFAELAAKLAG